MKCSRVLEIVTVVWLATGTVGLGVIVAKSSGPQPEIVRILECTLGTETHVPLSAVDTPIQAKMFGNGVVWYVADDVSNNAPYVYAQRAGEFCSVKEEK